jgi:hypothetical protein
MSRPEHPAATSRQTESELPSCRGCAKTWANWGEQKPRDSEYGTQLLNPDWAAIEAHYGVALPQVLKSFYANPEKVLQGEFEIKVPRKVVGSKRAFIATFTPIDPDCISIFEGFEQYMEIASDGGEGLYFISPRDNDSPVWHFDMEDYSLTNTGLSLGRFLSAERLPPRDLDEEEESLLERMSYQFRVWWYKLTKR